MGCKERPIHEGVIDPTIDIRQPSVSTTSNDVVLPKDKTLNDK